MYCTELFRMFRLDSKMLGPGGSNRSAGQAKVAHFPGLQGYPSHFGIDLNLSEDQITSIVHHLNFLLLALPTDFQTPLWNLLGYIAHLKDSACEATEYYRTVLRLDPTNIVATSDQAHIAEQKGELEEKTELEDKIKGWLQKGGIVCRRSISLAHLDIAVFYYYSGLRQATMYHLTTALSIFPNCAMSRFYYTFFSYLSNRITYHSPEEVSFHLCSLAFVAATRPNAPLLDFLQWIIETKSIFLPRDKGAVLEDKLQSRVSFCPLILLMVARELYDLESYEQAMDNATRSLSRYESAPAYFLLALCKKKLFEQEMESNSSTGNIGAPSGDGAPDTGNGTVQVVVEVQHDSKHTGTALLLPVKSIDQASYVSGLSRRSGVGKGTRSPRESEAVTEILSDNEDDTPVDPRILDMFDNIRYACILDPVEVSQLQLLTETLILCRKIDLAIVYLHETLRRCAEGEKVKVYQRLASCYLEQRDAEQAAMYLRLHTEAGGLITEDYMNLVVKLADMLMKLKRPLQAREWIHVMEKQQHPSSEHFTIRLKRLVGKDKNLLDAFNQDNKNNRNRKGTLHHRKKLGSSGS